MGTPENIWKDSSKIVKMTIHYILFLCLLFLLSLFYFMSYNQFYMILLLFIICLLGIKIIFHSNRQTKEEITLPTIYFNDQN